MNEEIQRLWAERTVQAISRTFPGVEFASWQRCQLFLPHALVCTILIEQWHMTFAEATRLLNRVGYYLCVRARYKEAEPLFKLALKIDEGAPEPRLSSVASHLRDTSFINYSRALVGTMISTNHPRDAQRGIKQVARFKGKHFPQDLLP